MWYLQCAMGIGPCAFLQFLFLFFFLMNFDYTIYHSHRTGSLKIHSKKQKKICVANRRHGGCHMSSMYTRIGKKISGTWHFTTSYINHHMISLILLQAFLWTVVYNTCSYVLLQWSINQNLLNSYRMRYIYPTRYWHTWCYTSHVHHHLSSAKLQNDTKFFCNSLKPDRYHIPSHNATFSFKPVTKFTEYCYQQSTTSNERTTTPNLFFYLSSTILWEIESLFAVWKFPQNIHMFAFIALTIHICI